MRAFEFDQFLFDPTDGRLGRVDDADEVRLRPQAGKLLARLLAQPGRVVDRDTLVREIWGEDTVVDFESGLAALLRELRRAIQSLGGDPGLIETVPRRGYRLRAQVRRIDGAGGDTTRSKGGRPASKRPVVIAIVVMTVAAILTTAALTVFDGWREPATFGDATRQPHQLAILPLERFGEPDYPPARAGILLADGILAALWRADLENLELIGRAGIRPYAGRDDVVSAVAADLGVDLLIEGTARFSSDDWRIDLRLLEVPPGRVVWSHTVAGREPALPTAAVATELVDKLAEAWPELRKKLE